MDKKLEQILRLYGEIGQQEGSPDDPSLREERSDFESVKRALDARPRAAVPESAVRNVLELARDDRSPQARRDRRPVPRAARRGRPLFAAAGSTLALLMIASVLLLGLPVEDSATVDSRVSADLEEEAYAPDQQVVGESKILDLMADARSEPQAERPATRRAQSDNTSSGLQTSQAREVPAASESLVLTASAEPVEPGLAWDDDEDVRRLHMMINVLQGRGDEIDWEEPAVPLELLQSTRDGRQGGIYQVSQPVPHR